MKRTLLASGAGTIWKPQLLMTECGINHAVTLAFFVMGPAAHIADICGLSFPSEHVYLTTLSPDL